MELALTPDFNRIPLASAREMSASGTIAFFYLLIGIALKK